MAIPDPDRVAAYAMGGIYLFGETVMSDDKTKSGGGDRKRISLSEDYEVRDWSAKFGVSEDRLREAVGRVGDNAEDVERELRGV